MRRLTAFFVAAGVISQFASHAEAASYTGKLARDTDIKEFFITLSTAGDNTFRTYSYAGGVNGAGTRIPSGGFNPALALFDSAGKLTASNQEGGCGTVAADPLTHLCKDAYLHLRFSAGVYRLVLTQFPNTANGPALQNSFKYFCTLSAQTAGKCRSLPGGFEDKSPGRRTSFYALDISGAETIQTPSITTSGVLPIGIAGRTYPDFTFATKPAADSFNSWTVISGQLPPGLALNALTGVVSGTPTSVGTHSFVVAASDGVQPVQQPVSMTVYDPLSIGTVSLPSGVAGKNYGPVSVAAFGGSGSWSWVASNLPPNLAISSKGQISGIPLSAGMFSNIVLSINDAVTGLTAQTARLSLAVALPPLVVTGSGNLGEIALGSGLAAAFGVTGGMAPYSWTADNLPAGVSLNQTSGALSGSPTRPGNFSFTLEVSDSQTPAFTASLPVIVRVLGLTTPPALPGASTASVYSLPFSAAGGRPPYSFSSLNAPPGLAFSGSTLTGMPGTAGSFQFTVQVMDANGFSASSSFSLLVSPPGGPLKVQGGALTVGRLALPYSDSLRATGGSPPYTWTITGGALPDGLSVAATGSITGTPTKPGRFAFTGQATDSSHVSKSGAFAILITPQPLRISGLPFPNGIEQVDYPLQIVSASGGIGPYTFAVTGTLPPGLDFDNGQLSGIPKADGTFSFSVTVTDSQDPPFKITAPVQTVINASNDENLILAANNISFSITAGAKGLPAPDRVTVRASNVGDPLNYSVGVTPAVSWLDVAGGGKTPGIVVIALNSSASALAASDSAYRASIVVTCLAPGPCAGSAQTIDVALRVTAPPPQLSLTQSLVQFSSTDSGTAVQSQSVGLQNIGGGSAAITSVTVADSWASVSGIPAAIPAGPAIFFTVTANPSGLGPGFYRTSITIDSPAGTVTLPVTLRITVTSTITLSTTGAQFQSTAGSSPGKANGSFQINFSSGSPLAWSAAVAPGAPWLILAPDSVSGTGSSLKPATVSFSIDPVASAGLPAHTWYATIGVRAQGVNNSPQPFIVVLNVAPAGVLARPDPEPAGLLFISTAGSAAPPAQNVTVYSNSPAGVAYSASPETVSGGTWLSVSPSTGTSSATASGISAVSVTPGGLSPGVYRGGVSFQFSAAAVRTVNVTLIVVRDTGAPAGISSRQPTSSSIRTSATGVCTPTQLVPTQTGLDDNFEQPTSWPTPLSVEVVDDCGSAVGGGQVVATFSNGDPPLALALVNAATGLYSGTWTPRARSSQVTVTAIVTAPGFPPASAQITGEVTANLAPVLAPGGSLHIYYPQVGGSVGPGTILQIYGSNLAPAPTPATALPLSTSLAGTSVIIGGIPAPLYYVSPNQINAQLPFELADGNQYQIIVNANGALSTPEPIQVSIATPGIAAFDTGQIIAQHGDFTLVSEDSPAAPGEYVVFYLAGLGLTDVHVDDGQSSPLMPLARPVIKPTLTLNGAQVPIYFSGLTPDLVGLYQMNFQVPPDAANGDIQLVVSQAGTASNSTILPVHN